MITYMQTDKRWKDYSYSVPGEKTTIGRAGCGLACAAMVVSNLAHKTVTPVTACNYSLANGYKQKGGGTYANFFPKFFEKYGIKSNIVWVASANTAKTIEAALKADEWVIACMRKGNWTSGTGHYVLAYKLHDGMVYIADPASTKVSRTRASFKQFVGEAKYYIVVHNPDAYVYQKFVRDIQRICKVEQTGKADYELLKKTITLSMNDNPTHSMVKAVQTLLADLGIYKKSCHGVYDQPTRDAVKAYQLEQVGLSKPDGIITAGKGTWKKMLNIE